MVKTVGKCMTCGGDWWVTSDRDKTKHLCECCLLQLRNPRQLARVTDAEIKQWKVRLERMKDADKTRRNTNEVST